MSNQKPVNYTENDRAIVAILASHPEGLTLAEINQLGNFSTPILAGHVTSAKRKGLIVDSGKRTVLVPSKAKKTVYHFVTEAVNMRADGKPWTYSEGELIVLKAAMNFTEGFIINDLEAVIGSDVASGVLTSLVKKGNFSKEDEKRIVATQAKREVNIYVCGPKASELQ